MSIRKLLKESIRPNYKDSINSRGTGIPAIPYAIWNIADIGSSLQITDNGLRLSRASPVGNWQGGRANVGKSTGKWGYEVTVVGDSYEVVGLASAIWDVNNYYPGIDTNGIGVYFGNSFFLTGNSFVLPNVGALTNGDVMTMLYDADTGSIGVKINGGAIVTKTTGFAGVEMFPAAGIYNMSSQVLANFGPLQYPEEGYNNGWWAE